MITLDNEIVNKNNTVPYRVNRGGEYLPLFELVKEVDFRRYDRTTGSSLTFGEIVDMTFADFPYIKVRKTRTSQHFGIQFGYLCLFHSLTNFEIIYSYVGRVEHKEKLKEAVSKGYTEEDLLQLWVRNNYRDYSPTLTKLIRDKVIAPAESKNIPVIYKTDFKEFFDQITDQFTTLKELKEFQDNLKQELIEQYV